jgi:hypothetical protein
MFGTGRFPTVSAYCCTKQSMFDTGRYPTVSAYRNHKQAKVDATDHVSKEISAQPTQISQYSRRVSPAHCMHQTAYCCTKQSMFDTVVPNNRCLIQDGNCCTKQSMLYQAFQKTDEKWIACVVFDIIVYYKGVHLVPDPEGATCSETAVPVELSSPVYVRGGMSTRVFPRALIM